jgi:hypothetical protein
VVDLWERVLRRTVAVVPLAVVAEVVVVCEVSWLVALVRLPIITGWSESRSTSREPTTPFPLVLYRVPAVVPVL